MKNVLYFLAGVMFIMLVSATTVSVMTVKPQMPKETLVKAIDTSTNIHNETAQYVIKMAKQGYVLKSITHCRYIDTYGGVVIVLEKY